LPGSIDILKTEVKQSTIPIRPGIVQSRFQPVRSQAFVPGPDPLLPSPRQEVNVLYDAAIFGQKYGGISRYFYEIIRRMAGRDGLNAFVFQGLYANAYPLNLCRNRCKFYFGVKRPVIPKTTWLFNKFNEIIFGAFLKLKSSGHIVYHPTYYSAKLPHVPRTTKVVLTVHDMVCELYPGQFANAFAELRSKMASLARADRIICISENTKNDLMRFYDISEEKITVIYHGPSLEADTSVPDGPPSRPYILYIGPRQTPYKNFTVLLNAFVNGGFYKDFDLQCFGSGRFSNREICGFDSLGVADRLRYADGDDTALACAYKRAACLVYPSLYEGFGLPVLEAMHVGCPVVASNASSIPEVAGDAAVLFEPRSTESLIAALRKVLYHESFSRALATAGLTRARMFSWDIAAEKTLRLYKSLV